MKPKHKPLTWRCTRQKNGTYRCKLGNMIAAYGATWQEAVDKAMDLYDVGVELNKLSEWKRIVESQGTNQ